MSVAAVASGGKVKAALLTEMCSVRLGQTLFGVPISHILEIVGSARPQPVPLAPSFVGGLIPQDILVIESAGGCFGLLVDSVGEVLTVSSVDFEPNPSILDERRRALFAGAYKLKDSLLVMLDPERLDPMRLSAARAA